MTVLTERIPLRRSLGRMSGRSLRDWAAWHPEWWVYAVAGASAVVLVAMVLGSTESGAAAGHHMHHGHEAMAMSSEPQGPWAAWPGAMGHWSLMMAAMMLPIVAPQVHRVALRSVRSRRTRGPATFLLGYVAVWLVLGAALLTVLVALAGPQPPTPWLVVALLAAAAWQVSGPRRRMLRRCGSLRLGAATGLAADLDCLRAGVRSGLRCAFACGPVMVAMALSHSLLLMAGVVAVLLSERARGANSVRRAGRPHEALVLGGFAVVAALAAPMW
jgi:hypothetical protein